MMGSSARDLGSLLENKPSGRRTPRDTVVSGRGAEGHYKPTLY